MVGTCADGRESSPHPGLVLKDAARRPLCGPPPGRRHPDDVRWWEGQLLYSVFPCSFHLHHGGTLAVACRRRGGSRRRPFPGEPAAWSGASLGRSRYQYLLAVTLLRRFGCVWTWLETDTRCAGELPSALLAPGLVFLSVARSAPPPPTRFSSAPLSLLSQLVLVIGDFHGASGHFPSRVFPTRPVRSFPPCGGAPPRASRSG